MGFQQRLPSLSIDNWNGHLFMLEKRKCIVFVHKETLYSFVLFDILKGHLKEFKNIFLLHYLEQLKADELLTPEIEAGIRKDFENFQLSTTDDDRSTIGYMNDCITRLKWDRGDNPPTIDEARAYVKNYYNDNLLMSRNFTTPHELMCERLKSYV